MAPTNSKTKHKPEITKEWEEVLDLVIPYLHDIDDRNSVSLVSRKSYEIDGITRKRLTVHTLYYPNPASLNKRFPFIEALTLKDLETLAKTRGKDLRSLKISKFEGFSTAGLRHVFKYCNQLRTLCVGRSDDIDLNDGLWLHELALNSTVLERFHFMCTDVSYAEDLTLLAKNCCNSLVSLKIGACYLSKLGDAFRYAVWLEHFAGIKWDEENELAGFQFPPRHTNRKLKLAFLDLCCECQCMLYERCPNLEVIHTKDVCGDKGLIVIGKFCKKLRKLTHNGLVTHVGLIALAKGCTKLECLKVRLRDISNEAIKFVGAHLKNLRKFRMDLVKKNGTTLDNGIQVMLMGCSKLQTLDITFLHGGLDNVGLSVSEQQAVAAVSLTTFSKLSAMLLLLTAAVSILKSAVSIVLVLPVTLTCVALVTDQL
ncbi:leucine-rich repeat, cysteine-containing subtype protein [Tanacetum coccineum]